MTLNERLVKCAKVQQDEKKIKSSVHVLLSPKTSNITLPTLQYHIAKDSQMLSTKVMVHMRLYYIKAAYTYTYT